MARKMEGFIRGTLVRNHAGATYEGVVYDRRLTIQVLNGKPLYIFDSIWPISTNLAVGQDYAFVLTPLLGAVEIVPERQTLSGPRTETETKLWQGTVLDLAWQFPEHTYQLARSDCEGSSWVLMETDVGQLLIHPDDVSLDVKVGTVLQWEDGRLDFCAVV